MNSSSTEIGFVLQNNLGDSYSELQRRELFTSLFVPTSSVIGRQYSAGTSANVVERLHIPWHPRSPKSKIRSTLITTIAQGTWSIWSLPMMGINRPRLEIVSFEDGLEKINPYVWSARSTVGVSTSGIASLMSIPWNARFESGLSRQRRRPKSIAKTQLTFIEEIVMQRRSRISIWFQGRSSNSAYPVVGRVEVMACHRWKTPSRRRSIGCRLE